MGAQSFVHKIKGRNAEECFRALVEHANIVYGKSSYNGSINTCSMGRKTLSLKKMNSGSEEEIYKHIEENGYGEKWRANYIEVGPIGYEVYTIKKVNTGAKPKYRMKYVVREKALYDPIKVFDTKKAADDYALKLAVKNLSDQYYVNKEYFLIDGDKSVTDITIKTKRYKTKPKLKPLEHRKIVPIYKYIFYGWASC